MTNGEPRRLPWARGWSLVGTLVKSSLLVAALIACVAFAVIGWTVVVDENLLEQPGSAYVATVAGAIAVIVATMFAALFVARRLVRLVVPGPSSTDEPIVRFLGFAAAAFVVPWTFVFATYVCRSMVGAIPWQGEPETYDSDGNLIELPAVDLTGLTADLTHVAVGAAVAGTIIALLGTVVVAAHLALRLIRRYPDVFGSDATSRTVGFAAAVYWFPSAFPYLILNPLVLLFDAGVRLPGRVWSVLESAERPGRNLFAVVETMTNLILEWLAASVRAISLYDLGLALAIWIAVGQLLSVSTTSSDQEGSASIRRISAFFRNMSSDRRRSLVLAGIFAVSAYLSIAAITAIPWLEDSTVDLASARARLEEQIRLTSENRAGLQDPSPGLADVDPFQALRSLVAPAESGDPEVPPAVAQETVVDRMEGAPEVAVDEAGEQDGSSDEAVGEGPAAGRVVVADPRNEEEPADDWLEQFRTELFGQARSELRRRERTRGELIGLRSELRTSVIRELDDLSGRAQRDFEITIVEMRGDRERLEYVRRLGEWFGAQRNALTLQLDRCESTVRSQDRRSAQWSQRVADALNEAIDAFRRQYSDASSYDGMDPWIEYNRARVYRTLDSPTTGPFEDCRKPELYSGLPDPPEPGSQWGIFGRLAHFILTTQSQALALITGMLGFGLLGAGVAPFVRERSARLDLRSIDLGGLVVRGVSAAVVLFLSVKGGLAIFSTSETHPNAYVLFFLCFVGAVYGETVWTWALEKLRDQLGYGADGEENRSGAGGDGAAGGGEAGEEGSGEPPAR